MYKEITSFVTFIVYRLKLCFLFGNFDGHGLFCCYNLPRNRFSNLIATNSCRYHTDIISVFFFHGFPVARTDIEFLWNFVYFRYPCIYQTFIGFHTRSTCFASGELWNIASVQMLQLLKLSELRVKICEITGNPYVRAYY